MSTFYLDYNVTGDERKRLVCIRRRPAAAGAEQNGSGAASAATVFPQNLMPRKALYMSSA